MATSDSTLLLTANKDIERFLSKVHIPDDPDACWEWTGCFRAAKRYGQFSFNDYSYSAHRWIYQRLNCLQLPPSIVG